MQVNELYNNESITIKSYLEKCGVKDTGEYLYPTGKYIDNWREYKELESICQELEYWSKTDETIFIIQDGDVDGICSTAILYQYLIKFSSTWDIKIIIHSGKQRGLDDEDIMNRIRKDYPVLVIVPDAGSNNYIQAEELCEMGIGLIVLDHHNIDTPIKSGTLISNQRKDCNVSRNGSGTLVTHKLLQAMDELYNHRWSGDYIDLVALSLLSDSMDMAEMENREYYYFGLEDISCVQNTFLKAVIDKFIGQDTYTQRDISFKVIPKFNAVTRQEDAKKKQDLMIAFCYGENIEETLNMIEQAHQNQVKIVDDVIQNNMDTILSCGQNNLVIFASDSVPRSYSGLLAGKIKTLCDNKPTIVGSVKDGYMIGSLRSPIPLKEELNNNELIDFCSGHDDAAGVGLYGKNNFAAANFPVSL